MRNGGRPSFDLPSSLSCLSSLARGTWGRPSGLGRRLIPVATLPPAGANVGLRCATMSPRHHRRQAPSGPLAPFPSSVRPTLQPTSGSGRCVQRRPKWDCPSASTKVPVRETTMLHHCFLGLAFAAGANAFACGSTVGTRSSSVRAAVYALSPLPPAGFVWADDVDTPPTPELAAPPEQAAPPEWYGPGGGAAGRWGR